MIYARRCVMTGAENKINDLVDGNSRLPLEPKFHDHASIANVLHKCWKSESRVFSSQLLFWQAAYQNV